MRLHRQPLKDLMKEYGCDHVGNEAVDHFGEILEEEVIAKLVKDIAKITDLQGRKTTKKGDVETALSMSNSKPL